MARVQIYDTTLRDGMQAEGVSFSLEDKVFVARRLAEFGVDYIEGGFPMSNPKEAQFFGQVIVNSVIGRDCSCQHRTVGRKSHWYGAVNIFKDYPFCRHGIDIRRFSPIKTVAA